MKVKATDTFFESLKKIENSHKPWKFVFWKYKLYDLKRIIKNLIKYFKIVTKMTPWSYHSILEMLEFQLKILKNSIENGIEVEESRMAKVRKIERSIELIRNQLDENYAERCGWVSRPLKFTPDKDNENIVSLDFEETEEEAKQTKDALKKGRELEESEWNELFNTLKEMRGWWD